MEDGHAEGVTKNDLDAFLHQKGLADALIKAKWLKVDRRGVWIPNHDRHLGETAKKRGLAAQRKRKERQAGRPETSRNQRDKNATRVEKSREEKSREEQPPSPSALASAAIKRVRVGDDRPLLKEQIPSAAQLAMVAYTKEVKAEAWRILLAFVKYCPGARSDRTLGEMAAAFADRILANPNAETSLKEYFAVTDPKQIERECAARVRLGPGASPWEICKFLFG
ncbi:MAG: hypothetical protein QM703_25465 [Gemmatales bacterium]